MKTPLSILTQELSYVKTAYSSWKEIRSRNKLEKEVLSKPVMGYCVTERKRVQFENPEVIDLKNGQPAVTGYCPCGTKMFKVLAWKEE